MDTINEILRFKDRVDQYFVQSSPFIITEDLELEVLSERVELGTDV